jgi:two-component sensor histidine kinase
MELELPPQAESPARARQFVERALTDRCPPRIMEAAALLASELVTNAVRHARTELTISIDTSRDGVRLEVHDDSPRMPELQRDPSAGSGRGLLLVERIAESWGATPCFGGKTVWVELTPRATEIAFAPSRAR